MHWHCSDDAGKKREAYMIEMQKLRDGQSPAEQSAVQGRLTISDIRLPLKSEVVSKIGSAHGKPAPVCNEYSQLLTLYYMTISGHRDLLQYQYSQILEYFGVWKLIGRHLSGLVKWDRHKWNEWHLSCGRCR